MQIIFRSSKKQQQFNQVKNIVMTLKELIKALKVLFLFQKGYTSFYRWFEISLGVFCYINLGIIIISIIRLLTK